jgi:hypothetical protein
MPGRILFSINEVRRISRHSCQGFCSISSVGPQGLCVWSNSLKGGAGNTYMPLHDHPYSNYRIINQAIQDKRALPRIIRQTDCLGCKMAQF